MGTSRARYTARRVSFSCSLRSPWGRASHWFPFHQNMLCRFAPKPLYRSHVIQYLETSKMLELSWKREFVYAAREEDAVGECVGGTLVHYEQAGRLS